jgi:hypothetical protein
MVEHRDPGGSETFPMSVVGAGGEFYVEWVNDTTYQVSWQSVSLNGSVESANLPLSRSVEWSFVFGNQTALFVTTGRLLLELNPTTLAVIANYSSALPHNVVDISAVLPAGPRIYLAGVVLHKATGVYRGFFGYLNLSSGLVTTVAHVGGTTDASVSDALEVMVAAGSDVFVGGAADFENASEYEVVSGLLYQYDPATSTFQNMSALLPTSDWGVFGLEPWGSTIAVSMNWFGVSFVNQQTRQVGGVYTLARSPTLHLVNVTDRLAVGYVPNVAYVTAGSSGWFFTGGGNSVSGAAQFVAIKP